MAVVFLELFDLNLLLLTGLSTPGFLFLARISQSHTHNSLMLVVLFFSNVFFYPFCYIVVCSWVP